MTKSIQILIVDDEDTVRDILRCTFARFGYEVTEAQSGNEAIALFKSGRQFDATISDYSMPDGDGAHLLQFIYDNHIQTLFTLFTGTLSPCLPPPQKQFLGIVPKTHQYLLIEKVRCGICPIRQSMDL